MIQYLEIYLIENRPEDMMAEVYTTNIVHGGKIEAFTVKHNESIMNYVRKFKTIKENNSNVFGRTKLRVLVSTDYGAYGNNLQILDKEKDKIQYEKFLNNYGEYL